MTALFSSVDRALVVAAFADRLRGAGVPVPITAIVRATDAVDHVGPPTVGELYWLLRVSFVTDHRQLATFDRLFNAVFDFDHRGRDRDRRPPRVNDGGAPRPGETNLRVRATSDGDSVDGGGVPWATRPQITADADRVESDTDLSIPERLPSPDEAVATRPFDLLDEAELLRIGTAIEAAMHHWPRRRARRRVLAKAGDRVHLRAGLRRALRTGGEPIDLPRSVRVERLRPIAVFVDVSGSMESFARAYLHLARPLVCHGRAEVFALATDATRITAPLRLRSPLEAIERAGDEVGDRFGGTRLATGFGTVLGHRTWRSAVRGAVVLVVSDGWDTDPPAELGRRMARLARLANRVVWVNPRAAADDFEPQVAGMSAALPYCDAFLPGNSLTAMDDVLNALAAD